MCKVSEKLKLCTCEFDPDKTKNYWEFSRYTSEEKGIDIVGTALPPVEIAPENDAFNRKLLSKLLNEGNVFDVDLNPRDKDRLLLSFQIKTDSWGRHLHYGYTYKNGEWIEEEFGPFGWSWHHDEEKSGKILNGNQRIGKRIV